MRPNSEVIAGIILGCFLSILGVQAKGLIIEREIETKCAQLTGDLHPKDDALVYFCHSNESRGLKVLRLKNDQSFDYRLPFPAEWKFENLRFSSTGNLFSLTQMENVYLFSYQQEIGPLHLKIEFDGKTGKATSGKAEFEELKPRIEIALTVPASEFKVPLLVSDSSLPGVRPLKEGVVVGFREIESGIFHFHSQWKPADLLGVWGDSSRKRIAILRPDGLVRNQWNQGRSSLLVSKLPLDLRRNDDTRLQRLSLSRDESQLALENLAGLKAHHIGLISLADEPLELNAIEVPIGSEHEDQGVISELQWNAAGDKLAVIWRQRDRESAEFSQSIVFVYDRNQKSWASLAPLLGSKRVSLGFTDRLVVFDENTQRISLVK